MKLKIQIPLLIGSILFLIVAGFGLHKLYPDPTKSGNTQEALTLSAVVLIGLALVVVLMAVLAIVYSILGVANDTQALALPEGSIRALIAFSLVLVFVCLAAFLYNGVNNAELISPGKSLTKITQAELDELRTQFVVAYEPARKTNGTLETDTDGKSPLYNVTYFPERSKDTDDFAKQRNKDADDFAKQRSKDAADFAKQIFTTLATIFVSVISFYFGSSVTSSGVGAGAKAASGGGEGGKKVDPQSVLADTHTAAHDAESAVDRATDAVKNAISLAATAPSDKKAAAEADAADAQKALNAATEAARGARQQVNAASTAVSEATAAGSDAAKANIAASNAVKARDSAKQLADQAKVSAAEAERLLNKIRRDTAGSYPFPTA